MIDLIELLNWTPGGILSYLSLAICFIVAGFAAGLYVGVVISINGFTVETIIFIWVTYVVAVLCRAGGLYSLHRYGRKWLEGAVKLIDRKVEISNRSVFNPFDALLFIVHQILRKPLAFMRMIAEDPVVSLSSLSERKLYATLLASRTIFFPFGAPVACIAGFSHISLRKFFAPVAIGQMLFCIVTLTIGWYWGKGALVLANTLGVPVAIASSVVVLGVIYSAIYWSQNESAFDVISFS